MRFQVYDHTLAHIRPLWCYGQVFGHIVYLSCDVLEEKRTHSLKNTGFFVPLLKQNSFSLVCGLLMEESVPVVRFTLCQAQA